MKKVFIGPVLKSISQRMLRDYLSTRIGSNFVLSMSKNKGKSKFCHAIL